MSGGQLVVLDRLGRDVKRFPLPEGLATIGSDPACDIRVMLSSVSPHHATVVVHANQTVVRNVSTGTTLVNGQPVSVAALRHRDTISLGGRALRWEYDDAAAPRKLQPETALHPLPCASPMSAPRRPRRSAAAAAAARAPDVRLALELQHRASMPGAVGGKQVAIVQPQRRDTTEQNGGQSAQNSPRQNTSTKRLSDQSKRRPARSSPNTSDSQMQGAEGTTKASLWIESRKRRSAPLRTPLRLAVLKKAQSARRHAVAKIQAPAKIDHTKQAAIMLMAGHTPKSRISPKDKRPSFVAKKASVGKRFSRSNRNSPMSVTVLEISDSSRPSTSTISRRSHANLASPLLPSPKKSALKDPSNKRNTRKTESIKFDLSNLENYDQSQDVFLLSDVTQSQNQSEDLSLHYDTSMTPSPRRSIHSRSSKILEKTLGTSVQSPSLQQSTLTPESPRNRKSSRGSIIVQKVLEKAPNESKSYSQRTTKSVSDQSYNTTVATAFRTRTLSPRSPNNIESYSIVDLVSVDSNESESSAYRSVRSTNSSNAFGTPQSTARRTRSTIDPKVFTSSTPYVAKTTRASRSLSNPNISRNSVNKSKSTRRSKSLTTPENTNVSLNTTRVSRRPRSRSRINDSDLLLISNVTEVENSSPKSSKRLTTNDKTLSSPILQPRSARKTRLTVNISANESPGNDGTGTPENRHSPQEVGTPVLSIQSLLDSSTGSLLSLKSTRGRLSKRNTIGGMTKPKVRQSGKSRSLVIRRSARRSSKSSGDSERTDVGAVAPDNEEMVTPKSAIKLVPEAVKIKHSTAKKPQSKRSIIDDLNDSDIVKQLFNSPVKRKLSQSMSEFSRKQLLDDDDVIILRRPTRNTIAITGRTPDNSLSNETGAFTPEVFVSPLNTPDNSPNLTGIKRLFRKQTPVNDLRNVRGVKALLRTPRTRRSIKNDLTRVSGVKNVFAKSPKNRLSDVRVKEVFAASPKNDLRRVSGVKALFQSERKRKTPKNDLRDVRGVKKLFTVSDSPVNDLRNVSGVKRTMQRNSPRNDLSDVRGVKRMFRREKETIDANVSGIEELFNESNQSYRSTDALFDKLIGKPTIKAVYSKTFTKTITQKKRRPKSLHASIDVISNNVEEWLEKELQKRLHKDKEKNVSKSNVTRELQKLMTDTVEGTAPIRTSRVRNSTIVNSIQADTSEKRSAAETYSTHTLPIKKRSLERARNSLPIKKRAIVHSTPVKGRLVLDASELGRVSPIVALDKTRQDDISAKPELAIVIEVPKPARGRKAKVETKKIQSPVKISPKKTRTSKSVAQESIGNQRTRRNTKTDVTQLTNTKKRRASLVVTKKAPVLSPKATRKAVQASPVSPKKTRRKTPVEKSVEKIKTPKRTRAKAQKTIVIVSKPSPVIKPRATKSKVSENVETKRTRNTRNTEVKKKESLNESIEKTRIKKTRGKQEVSVEPIIKTRGRKTVEVEAKGNKKSPRQVKNSPKAKNVPKQAKNSPKQAKNSPKQAKNSPKQAKVEAKKTRGNKTEEVSVEPKTRGRKPQVVEVDSKTKLEEKKTRGKKQTQVEAKRGPAQVKTANNRKRKSDTEPDVPSKLRKTRSANTSETKGKPAKESSKGKAKKEVEVAKPRATRGRGVDNGDSVPTVAATRGRGRQTKATDVTQPSRKRKTVATPDSAVKGAGRKQSVTKKSKVVAETPKKSARGKPAVAEVAQRTTRAKKR